MGWRRPAFGLLVLLLGGAVWAAEAGQEKRVPLDIQLPPRLFKGTPKDIPIDPRTREKPTDDKRPPFLAPEGTANVALKKPVTSSDADLITGDLAQITDGVKDGSDDCVVELHERPQWVQVDLQAAYRLYAIVVWHYHGEARFYRDVAVQIADDADFITNVRTVFNNDYDNSSGLGIGSDREYMDSYEGRLIPVRGEGARYVRFYSNGSTASDKNHYIEVEVYGKPVK